MLITVKMKHTIQLIVASFFIILLASCKQNNEKSMDIKSIDDESADAINPYLTKDQNGNVVMSWTSKDPIDSLYRLKYALYNESDNTFGEIITVPTSADLSTSPESMGKVAFKADGTVIAVFGKKIESPINSFAGAIYYSTSTDNGKNWSAEEIIHSDTSQNTSHSFFDIATLKDGEVAAVWLDGRFSSTEKGSALFFAKTEGNIFGIDTLLDTNTCECCRTDILSDDMGNIHIAYRSIALPGGVFGKQVRDMVYLSSNDGGESFSTIKPISADNWQVEGCPHTGPSLAVINQQVNAVWFTAGGGAGLYYTSSPNLSEDFKNRSLLSANGRHPQMATFAQNKLAVVYEENAITPSNAMEYNDAHASMKMHNASMDMNMDTTEMVMEHSAMEKADKAQIVLQLIENGNKTETIKITDGKQPNHHAVIAPINNQVLVAWIHEENGKASINYSRIF